MSETSDLGFTPKDKIFFGRIRDDILARPVFYRCGMDYLQRRWSVAALHEKDLAERERLSKPDSRSARQLATHFSGTSTGPEYERAYQHFMQPAVFSLADRLAHAFDDLRQEGLGTGDEDLLTPYDLDKAKAVLCLTWLLADPQADQHALGAGYGKWGDDSAEQVTLEGRAMARLMVFDGHLAQQWRREWVRLAQQAWDVLHQDTGMEAHLPKGVAVADTRNGNESAVVEHQVTSDGYCSPSDIAKALKAPKKVDAIRMALKRMLDDGALPDGAWMENADPAKGQAKILYRLSAIRPFLSRFERVDG